MRSARGLDGNFSDQERPMPPASLFEKKLKTFAMGSAEGASARNTAAKYPEVLRLGLESESVTVLNMRLSSGAAHRGMGVGAAREGWEALVKLEIKHAEKNPEREGMLFRHVGLKADKKSDGLHVVKTVTKGGLADSWGVGAGMKVVRVGGDLRSVTIAMHTPFTPPSPQGLAALAGLLATNPCAGGVAFVAAENSEMFTRLSMSIDFSLEEALLYDCSCLTKSIRLGPHPTEEERRAAVAKKQTLGELLVPALGFDVEENFRPGYPYHLVVKDVVTGSRVALLGLRNKDVLLCLNGAHLLFISRMGFLMRVAHGLRRCVSGAKSSGVLRFLVARKRSMATPGSAFERIGSPPPLPLLRTPGPQATTGEMKPSRKQRKGEGKGKGKGKGKTKEKGKGKKMTVGGRGSGLARAWDEPSDTDAVHSVPLAVVAASAAAAALERNRRAEARQRPEWWEPRAKGASQHVLKLRPASSLPGRARGASEAEGGVQRNPGVEETNGGEPGPPGAFLQEDLQIGQTLIPAGSQLISVGGISCRDFTFNEARALALTGSRGTSLCFERKPHGDLDIESVSDDEP